MKAMRTKLLFSALSIALAGIFFNSCQSDKELEYARYYTNGKVLYETHCQNCHSSTGSGLGLLIPPLNDTTFLKKNRNNLSCFIKNGLTGSITVAGKAFDGEMPAEDHLADIEIAEIITYITNSFGNKQGIYKASQASADLEKCK